jgi:hypothetical protein
MVKRGIELQEAALMSDETTTLSPEISKNGLTSNLLKYIAIIAMICDHMAVAFVPQYSVLYIVMRFIGRITGPVMFFAAAEGYHRTHDINRYMARLAIFAVVSYFPFIFFENHGALAGLSYTRLNVIYTIFLGVAAIRVRRELKNPVVKTIVILILIVLSTPGDWSYVGVFMILAFDYFYGDFKKQALVYCVLVLLGMNVIGLFSAPISEFVTTRKITLDLRTYAYYIINAGGFIPIVLLYFYNSAKGKGGRFAKWFFYVFYPLHLLILGFLQRLLK